jgi:hypothetical protein
VRGSGPASIKHGRWRWLWMAVPGGRAGCVHTQAARPVNEAPEAEPGSCGGCGHSAASPGERSSPAGPARAAGPPRAEQRAGGAGTMGLVADLTAGEVLEQLVFALRVAPVRNVVFMVPPPHAARPAPGPPLALGAAASRGAEGPRSSYARRCTRSEADAGGSTARRPRRRGRAAPAHPCARRQGMGEPLNNWEPVKAAVRAMVDPNRFGLKRSKVRRHARVRQRHPLLAPPAARASRVA